MKRSHLELRVCVRTAELDTTVPSEPREYPILELAHLDYFLNAAQLVEDQDVLHVDLCEQGLSPWPVSGSALESLVDLFKPLSILPDERLSVVLERGCTALVPLLLAADALSLRRGCWDALDAWVRDHLSANPKPVMCWATHGDWDGLELEYTWASDELLTTADGTAFFQHSEVPASETILPAVRWAVLEMYCMLDQLQLKSARKCVADCIVCPGEKLLYGDEQWKVELQQLLTSGRLSKEGQHALFVAALDAKPKEAAWDFSAPTLSISIKQAFTAPQQLFGTHIEMQYDKDACNSWMPLTISCKTN